MVVARAGKIAYTHNTQWHMTDRQGIFFDEWQACLRAHFTHVVRANDTNTEVTLRGVLLQTGLTDDDLDDLRAIAQELGPLEDESAPDAVEAGDAEPVSEAG